MRIVKQTKLIKADIEEVWLKITDHCNLDLWLLPSAKIYLDPEGLTTRNGKGAVRVINQLGFSGAEKILDFNPPNRMTYSVIKGLPVKSHLGEIILYQESGYTKIDWVVKFHSTIPGMNLLLSYFINKTLNTGLNNLDKIMTSERIHG
jgi:uncharacterized protein YndB with AHSA1/START domain